MFSPTAHTKKGREIIRRLRQDWKSLDFNVGDNDSTFDFRSVLPYDQQTELDRRRIVVSIGCPGLVSGSGIMKAYVDRIEENRVYAHYW